MKTNLITTNSANIIACIAFLFFLLGCSSKTLEDKGISVASDLENHDLNNQEGIFKDSLEFETKPSNVLLTGISNYRLATIYKVNYNRKRETSYIGSNYFHNNFSEIAFQNGNNWNDNYMPGLEAVQGHNMVNIAHYNTSENSQKTLFDKPVLIKTLYYPAFSKDTLNFAVVNRDYFMVSVYDEDTNEDNFINDKDLRRFYLFNIDGEKQKPLVPENYSVFKSEYDPANDFMYVFAQLDENNNGQRDEQDAIHIFWINLKNPKLSGRLY